ncbi:MAG: hypothetical protein ACTSXJ_11245 [Candidatus Baldrarchaeia archaeon]
MHLKFFNARFARRVHSYLVKMGVPYATVHVVVEQPIVYEQQQHFRMA